MANPHPAGSIAACAGLGTRTAKSNAATSSAAARQNLGMHFCIEDVWGGDVTAAAASHVAASAQPGNLLHTSFFNDWTEEHVAGYQPRVRNGRGAAPEGAGLGITIDRSMIGDPVASFS